MSSHMKELENAVQRIVKSLAMNQIKFAGFVPFTSFWSCNDVRCQNSQTCCTSGACTITSGQLQSGKFSTHLIVLRTVCDWIPSVVICLVTEQYNAGAKTLLH